MFHHGVRRRPLLLCFPQSGQEKNFASEDITGKIQDEEAGGHNDQHPGDTAVPRTAVSRFPKARVLPGLKMFALMMFIRNPCGDRS